MGYHEFEILSNTYLILNYFKACLIPIKFGGKCNTKENRDKNKNKEK